MDAKAICVICNEKRNEEVSQITLDSLATIQESARRWNDVSKYMDVHERVKGLSFSSSVVVQFHRKCYKSLPFTRSADLWTLGTFIPR